MLAESVETIAAPSVVARGFHYSGPHRIQLNITAARKQIFIPGYQNAFKTILPEMTDMAVLLLVVLRITQVDAFHDFRQRPLRLCFHDKVDMIGHQNVMIEKESVFILISG